MFKRLKSQTSSSGISMNSVLNLSRNRLATIVVFVGLIWLVYLLSFVLPLNQQFGLVPRSIGGLSGIVFMPFLHANLGHIMSNTAALLVMLVLLAFSRPRAWAILFVLTLVSGVCLWIFGRSANHIGASGVIYALMGFLITAGIMERRPLSLIAAIVVGITYGSVILSGIIPGTRGVSWEGHLVGLLAGAVIAWMQFRRNG